MNYRGISRTARLSRVIVLVVLGVLTLVVVFGLAAAQGGVLDTWEMPGGGARAVLQSSGLIFFAFAGVRAAGHPR